MFLRRHLLITNSLQAILISRFLINLRRAYQPNHSVQSQRAQRVPALQSRLLTTASIINDMGGPLQHDLHEDDENGSSEAADIELELMDTAHTLGRSP